MRHGLVLFHRYAGLALAGLLFLAGLTGAVLAFQREIDAALNPQLFRTASSRPALPLQHLKTRVEQQLPGAAVVVVQPPWEVRGTALLRVEPRQPGPALTYDEVFADPASGRVLGVRLWGACCLERVNAIPFIFKLHYTLHLPGAWGLWIMGGAALLWSIDCVVALALSAPRGGRWRAGWWRALTLKPGASAQRRTLDLHRAPGLWVWLVLLVTALTGVGLNLRDQVFEPVVSLVSPVTPPVFERPVPAKPGSDRLTFDEAAAKARQAALARGRPGVAAYLVYSPDLHAYGVAVARPGPADPRSGLGPDWYYIDARDAGLRAVELAGRGTAGDIAMQSRYPLHTGLIFGRFGQVLICIVGLATATLSVTGVLVWSAKRRARLRKSAGELEAALTRRRKPAINSTADLGAASRRQHCE